MLQTKRSPPSSKEQSVVQVPLRSACEPAKHWTNSDSYTSCPGPLFLRSHHEHETNSPCQQLDLKLKGKHWMLPRSVSSARLPRLWKSAKHNHRALVSRENWGQPTTGFPTSGYLRRSPVFAGPTACPRVFASRSPRLNRKPESSRDCLERLSDMCISLDMKLLECQEGQ